MRNYTVLFVIMVLNNAMKCAKIVDQLTIYLYFVMTVHKLMIYRIRL